MTILKKGAVIVVEEIFTGHEFGGTFKERKGNSILIETPNGEKWVNLLEVIVTVLPLIDRIIAWVVLKFKNKKNAS